MDKLVTKHGLPGFKKRKTEIETVRVRDTESDREAGGTKPRKPVSNLKTLDLQSQESSLTLPDTKCQSNCIILQNDPT